jgi:hypothetical protein
MLTKVDGHRVATDLAIKALVQLLHRRGVLDMIEFAEELEVRALLLAKTDDESEVAPAAALAAGCSTSWPRICGKRLLALARRRCERRRDCCL